MYFCKKCNEPFLRRCAVIIHERFCGTQKHAKRAQRRRQQIVNIDEIIVKLTHRQLKKFNITCTLCGWNKAHCDAHHIISLYQGGLNQLNNIVIVCPNCHRLIHEKKEYSISFLQEKSVAKLFDQWTDFKEFYLKKQRRIKEKYQKLSLPKFISKDIQIQIAKVQALDIDFMKYGWVGNVAKLLNIKPQKVKKWMTKNMSTFYEQHCFKRSDAFVLNRKLLPKV